MSQIIFTAKAVEGLERCRLFLTEKSPAASRRASQTIEKQFFLLAANPKMGRPLFDYPELREWIIDFGDSGYVLLYRFDEEVDAVYVLAFRHQKEAGY